MSCFTCFSSKDKKRRGISPTTPPRREEPAAGPPPIRTRSQQLVQARTENSIKTTAEATNNRETNAANYYGASNKDGGHNIAAEPFTFRELATATKNFRQECLIGEGGFGRVYKGHLDKIGQIVAVKQLDRNGLQGNKEFLVEVLMLSLLHHENLVKLIGYCADGEQRLLVYEYMPLGSLEDHLFDVPPAQPPLAWSERMKIALHAAKGLEYLHDKANPPVIFRDLKSSNILLDKEFNAKLSDFGLAKLGPLGEKNQVSSRVMGTYGYCAPEYQRTGQLTAKSDVYSFGVVFLELLTGKRVIDTTRRLEEQNLVAWTDPIFKEPRRFTELADPLLEQDYPKKSFNQAVAVAAMCLQEDPSVRPMMSDVVTALNHLWVERNSGFDSPDSPGSPPSPRTTSEEPESYQSVMAAKEREEAVAEAIEWGSRSRNSSK